MSLDCDPLLTADNKPIKHDVYTRQKIDGRFYLYISTSATETQYLRVNLAGITSKYAYLNYLNADKKSARNSSLWLKRQKDKRPANVIAGSLNGIATTAQGN